MKLIALTTLLTATLSSAIPCHTPQSTVTLRLISSLSNHYTNDQQMPSGPKGDILNVIVGQTLSLDHAPIHLQAIEIAEVSAGVDLGSPPKIVGYDDPRVVCKAKTSYGCTGVEFKLQDQIVAVSGGDVVPVTGLECWLEE